MEVDVEASSRLRELLQQAAKRPGMFMLQENYRQAVAFVMGCAVASPGLFNHFNAWSAIRLRGAREKFGWPYAVGVLAMDRVARDPDAQQTECPLVRQFLTLVCEYLLEVEADNGPASVQAEYERVRRDYAAAHQAAHSHGTIPNSDRWYEECRKFESAYVPELRRASSPTNPWSE